MGAAASGPPGTGSARSVGQTIARLRKRVGLTGRELAYRMGVSQPTISRIENGKTLPTPDVVEALARILDASDAEIAALRVWAEQRPHDTTDWIVGQDAAAVRQRYVRSIEARTTETRVFQSALLTGLLQTAEYARAVLTSAHAISSETDETATAKAVAQSVTARIARQEALTDPGKTFRFVIMEPVLGHRLCRPAEMIAQIQRLRDVAAHGNVIMRIVTPDAELFFPPYHAFEVLDDSHVFVDLFNGSLTVSGPADVAAYRRVFDDIEQRATDDIGPILDRHERHYLDLASR